MKSTTAVRSALVVTLTVLLAGCGSAPVHEAESFDPKAPYQYRVPTDLDSACQAARMALLSQGYATESVKTHEWRAIKSFQPSEDLHSVIEVNLVCAATRWGATLYVNALEKTFELKKTSKSAGISISSLGAINLPWGSSSDSLVMVASKTIDNPLYYRRYYDLIDQHLGIRTTPNKP